jgi:coatomer subunit beta
LKASLEKGSDEEKIRTLKRILILMLNGDPLPGLLMHVIRFIMPAKNKTLKKLLLVYWEICPKVNPDGKLKQEMVLVWYYLSFISFHVVITPTHSGQCKAMP